jgi:8-oxo-dGTP diphosphatase
MTAPTETPICVAIAVVEHEGRFLVGTRPAGAPLAGFAEFPGGKVHPGETPAVAAARECWEESGMTVQVVEEYLSTIHRYDHGLLEIHFFRCRPLTAGIQPRFPFRWVPAQELSSLRFPAANAALTDLLLRQSGIAVAQS